MKNKLVLISMLLFASVKDTSTLSTDNVITSILSVIAGFITGAGIKIYRSYCYTTATKNFFTIVHEASVPSKDNDEAEIATLAAHYSQTKKALANAQQSNLIIELLGKDEKTFIADKLNEITECVQKNPDPWKEKAKTVNDCFNRLCQKWKKTNPEKDCINILCTKK